MTTVVAPSAGVLIGATPVGAGVEEHLVHTVEVEVKVTVDWVV